MPSITLITLLLYTVSTSSLTVWPKPRSQTDTNILYTLTAAHSFSFNSIGPGAQSNIIHDAFKRYQGIIFLHTPSSIDVNDITAPSTITSVTVNIASDDEALTLETDQSYNITITAPTITIHSNTVYGALYALESFSQLVDRGTFVNGTTIIDYPRYHFRSSMIDTARHYYPKEVILQHLDAMSYNKFNILHWHIVDSIAFPYQSKTFPSMSETGAYSPDHVYTFDDIKEIVSYAKHRGIRVIPEFDTPGHVREGFTTLDPPILTTCYDSNNQPIVGDGATGPLNPTINATFTFLEQLYLELSTLFTDKFVHVGGDEVSFDCWATNPDIKKYMQLNNLSNFVELETIFEQKLLNILDSQNKSYIVWQDIFDQGAKLAADTVIAVWKSETNSNPKLKKSWQGEMTNVTKAGFQAVLSAPFYMNYISYGEDWTKYYQIEPSNFTGGDVAEAAGLVGGVEVCMWSEYVDAANFISRVWPRASTVGERGWSSKDTRNIDDARTRLHEFRCKLLARGINAEPITNGGDRDELNNHNFCPQEWVPTYNRPWDIFKFD